MYARRASKMRIGFKLVVLIAVVTMTAIVFTFGRGPVGPESVVRKEVQDRVREAAARAEAMMSPPPMSANPDLLKLPFGLEIKRRLKRMLSAVGVVSPAQENAMQFTLRQQHGPQSIQCLVVLRGDHVIGLAIIHNGEDHTFADRVQSALEMEFPRYKVQRLRLAA
jgi:hypothetical protein